MTQDPFIEGTKDELLKTLHKNSEVGSTRFEQQKTAIFVQCVKDIEKSIAELNASINTNSSSSISLAKKVFWLDIILTLATCIGVLIAYFEYFK